MEKRRLIQNKLLFAGILSLLVVLLLVGCQAEDPPPPTISIEDLSPIKQGYYRSGLIELIPDDLPPPPLADEPTQADLGEQSYYQICLACHGNWGQGLTDEWRETGFGEDAYCWESKCHGSRHPPQGFEFPREIPPLLGKGAISRISNAQELYQIIYRTMPWWYPGSLSEDEALNLTAYIMRARGELPEGIVLTQANLEAFRLHAPAQKLVDEDPFGIFLISSLSVAMLAYAWVQQFPDSRNKS